MKTRKLTARTVETFKTAADREDLPDALVRGLQLRVTGQGTKSWAYRYTRKSDGKRRRLTLGTYPSMSLDEARTQAREAAAIVDRGKDPAAAVQALKAAETFAEVAADWLERHAKPRKRPGSVADDQYMLKRHILPEIGSLKASEIQRRDLRAFLDRVAAKSDSRSNKVGEDGKPRRLTHAPNRVFALVRSIFRWAAENDLITADPTSGIKAPAGKEAPRARALSPSEIKQLWAALDRAPAQKPYRQSEGDFPMTRGTSLAIKLALATGQRIGEVAGITLEELSLNDIAPVWEIPGPRTKNKKPHLVPLSPLAMRLIREAIELAGNGRWLFPARAKRSGSGKGPIESHAPTKALERARPAIGLANFRIHDLRRTVATRMAATEIAVHTIGLVLNHSAKGITEEVYVQHSYDPQKRAALNAWAAQLEQIIAGKEGANVVALGARSAV